MDSKTPGPEAAGTWKQLQHEAVDIVGLVPVDFAGLKYQMGKDSVAANGLDSDQMRAQAVHTVPVWRIVARYGPCIWYRR